MDVQTGMCSYYMELHKLCLLIDVCLFVKIHDLTPFVRLTLVKSLMPTCRSSHVRLVRLNCPPTLMKSMMVVARASRTSKLPPNVDEVVRTVPMIDNIDLHIGYTTGGWPSETYIGFSSRVSSLVRF